jgi:two-component sensor histidine kinase
LNFSFSQEVTIRDSVFEKKLKMIRLLTDTQQYSEAMRELNAMEGSVAIKKSVSNEVEYRLMIARVLRLSGDHDAAMQQLNSLPDLNKNKKLKLKVDFRKAALYTENPKYSMEERVEIVYPIIERSIATAKELNLLDDLASFYNLKATMHRDECAYIERNCKENKKLAMEFYKKSMKLFLVIKDTVNYHNVLNGLFRLSMEEKTADMDSLKKLVDKFTKTSVYAPNNITSHNLLGGYYLHIKKDSVKYLSQIVMSKDESLQMIHKNADNTVNKMKVLYKFDSLNVAIFHNKNMLTQKDILIQEKSKSIYQNIVFSIILGVLILILIALFLNQRRLGERKKIVNKELEKSNRNYQLLIKESNHRIKNNLQMILSIIALDMENGKGKNKQALYNISAKIATITALHRILNFEEHNQKVELRTYFGDIIEYYINLSGSEISFSTDFANVKIPSERIIYFGLILNELISNTIQHRSTKEDVVIQVLKSEESNIFIYRDSSNFEEFVKKNGITLIEDLISRFGGDDLSFNSKTGEYKFYFDE